MYNSHLSKGHMSRSSAVMVKAPVQSEIIGTLFKQSSLVISNVCEGAVATPEQLKAF